MTICRSRASSAARARVHVGERLRALAAIDRDHAGLPGVPAEERDPHQLALHDEGGIGQTAATARRSPTATGAWRRRAAVPAGFSPGRGTRPRCRRPRAAARDWCAPRTWRPPRMPQRGISSVGIADDDVHEQIQIEQDVEDDGAKDRARTRPVDRVVAVAALRRRSARLARRMPGRARMRSLAKMYFTYSENISLAVARARPPRLGALPLRHHRERRPAPRREADARSRPARAACGSSTSPRSASGSRGSRPSAWSRSHCRAC